jgi:hypothetical protein
LLDGDPRHSNQLIGRQGFDLIKVRRNGRELPLAVRNRQDESSAKQQDIQGDKKRQQPQPHFDVEPGCDGKTEFAAPIGFRLIIHRG